MDTSEFRTLIDTAKTFKASFTESEWETISPTSIIGQWLLCAEAVSILLDQDTSTVDIWCREETCEFRHWRSGSIPTHKRGSSCPPSSSQTGD